MKLRSGAHDVGFLCADSDESHQEQGGIGADDLLQLCGCFGFVFINLDCKIYHLNAFTRRIIKSRCINNLIIIKENSVSYTDIGIHYEKTYNENYTDIQYLFGTFLIIAKCKYIICSSSNCSVWIMYYRENAENIYQNLNKIWL